MPATSRVMRGPTSEKVLWQEVPTVLIPKGIFPLPTSNTDDISENVPTAKMGILTKPPTSHPSRRMCLECKALCQASGYPEPEGKCRTLAGPYGSCSVQRGIRCLNQGSKVNLADFIFRRSPIPRPDRFLSAPMAIGTKVEIESPLVKEMI